MGSSLVGPRTESPKCHGATAAHLYFSVLAGHGQVGTVHLEHILQECPGQQTGKVLSRSCDNRGRAAPEIPECPPGERPFHSAAAEQGEPWGSRRGAGAVPSASPFRLGIVAMALQVPCLSECGTAAILVQL